jgi:YVTN family beta-propeller protein
MLKRLWLETLKLPINARLGALAGKSRRGLLWCLMLLLLQALPPMARAAGSFLVCVSNERGGDVTLIDGATRQVIASIPVGKRPRGLHPSPDGKLLYVALSGSPISGPPQLDAQGNPILKKGDDDDEKNSDHSADGIGVVDLQQKKFLRKIPAGSDPEQFAVSADGSRLFISNEDVATASIVNVASGKVEHIIPVKKEPEGVSLKPDGKLLYVTCETGGEIFVIDTALHKTVAQFTVGGRPRTVAFLPDGTRGFIPSESAGELHQIDAVNHKVLKTIKLPAGARPMGTAVSADGGKIYVTTGRGGTVCVLDTATLEVLGNIKVGPRPWGVALSPDGKYLYAANGPSNDISVVDLAEQKEIGRVKAGESPWGIAIVAR